MICKNCGAEYEDSAIVCPYCGAQNDEEASRRSKAETAEFHKDVAEAKKVHWYKAFSWQKKAAVIIPAVLVIVLVFTLVGTLADKLHEKIEKKQMDIALEELEELYATGEYDGLYDKVMNLDGYDRRREKYYEVGFVYDIAISNINEVKAELESRDTAKDPYAYYSISYSLWSCRQGISRIEEHIHDSADRGNEEVLEGFMEQIYDYMKNTLLLTDDEIEEILGYSSEEWNACEEEWEMRLYERLGIRHPLTIEEE